MANNVTAEEISNGQLGLLGTSSPSADPLVNHQPDVLAGPLGAVDSIPEVRHALENVQSAWAGELVSERDHKWRVGRALLDLDEVLKKCGRRNTFLGLVESLVGLKSQPARHRMRVVAKEKEIREAAGQKGKDFASLTWSEMLELIRVPNVRSKDQAVTPADGVAAPKPQAEAQPETPNPVAEGSGAARLTFSKATLKQRMKERKIHGSVENLLELIRELAGVEVVLEVGGQ